MADQQNSPLKEHDGCRCGKCQEVFLASSEKCPKCGGPVEASKWYSRLLWERVAFMGTLIVFGAIVSQFLPDAEARQTAPLIVAFMVPATYFTANYFMGIGGLTVKFAPEAVPQWARYAFSWSRYFRESILFIGLIVALFVMVGMDALFEWAFSKK